MKYYIPTFRFVVSRHSPSPRPVLPVWLGHHSVFQLPIRSVYPAVLPTRTGQERGPGMERGKVYQRRGGTGGNLGGNILIVLFCRLLPLFVLLHSYHWIGDTSLIVGE